MMDPFALRVATRPIPIDKRELQSFVSNLLAPNINRWLTNRPEREQDEPIGQVNNIALEFLEIEEPTKWGNTHTVRVQAHFIHAKKAGFPVLRGSSREGAIDLYLNGAFTPRELSKTEGYPAPMQPLWSCRSISCLPYGLYSTLLHEITHSAESIFKHKTTYSPSEVLESHGDDATMRVYLNDPGEVRAHMQQVVDEVIKATNGYLSQNLRDHAAKKPNANRVYVDLLLKLSTTWGLIEKHLTPRNQALILKAVYAELDQAGLLLNEKQAAMDPLTSRVAARYKQKKIVDSEKGGKTTVYLYSERQIARRNAEKAKRLEKLRASIGQLRSKVKRDLKSSDPEKYLTALAVALIDHTYERVGNEESAKERKHYGVTSWRKRHISFGKGRATIKYTGKSGVEQNKTVSDKAILTALRNAYEALDDEDTCLFDHDLGKVTPEKINAYLKPFNISAKDLRGFHANREMQERLKKVRATGKALSEDKKERVKQLKAEFKKALEETAEAVGHEASTLRSQYLVPGLEEAFTKDGTVMSKMLKDAAFPFEQFPQHYLKTCVVCGNTEKCRCMQRVHESNPPVIMEGVCCECSEDKLPHWHQASETISPARRVAERYLEREHDL